MKKQMYLGAILLLIIPNIAFSARIEGYWYNHDYDVQIHVIPTKEGIKVKRGDQGEWYYYEKISSNKYEDHRRNRYKLLNDQLVWISNDGLQELRFKKKVNQSSHNYSENYRVENAHICNHTGGCQCAVAIDFGFNEKLPYRLEGRWNSANRRSYLKIKKKNSRIIKVKTNHSGYRKYFKITNNRYADQLGSTILFTKDGKALVESPDGRQKYIYYKWIN